MKLSEPIEIRGMTLKNRLGFAPFLNMPQAEDGGVSDLTIRWFEARAQGGVGFIMTGAVRPTHLTDESFLARAGLALNEDKFVPGFRRLADAIHSHGACLGVQIAVLGPLGGLGMSPLPYPDERHAADRTSDVFGRDLPIRVLSAEEIERVEDDIAVAAVRAKAAGIDCVELHCAHGGATLHCASISPFYNRRTDRYGGDWEGRLRLPVNTVRKIREAVGDDYPIIVRIDADELLGERGIQVADAAGVIVPALEAAGADCIDVSQGSILHSPEGITIPLYYPRGCFIHHAAAVKRATSLPVIGVGNIFDLDMAEKFLQEEKADVIYLGRQVTADPDTPNKYFAGRADEVRKCIGCLGGCGRPCSINYDIQDEPVPLVPAERSRRVLVVGGGVAGMEAARVAATRGHEVTLIEKGSSLGGMVRTLALNPLTADIGNVVEYLATQMGKLGVDVRVCHEATAEGVRAIAPDVVIVAAGSDAVIPEAAAGEPGVMTLRAASESRRAIGQRVVVWGLFGAEMAITLAGEGKDVTLLGRGGEGSLGSDVANSRRWWLVRKLTDANVPRATPAAQRLTNPAVLYNAEVEEIKGGEIHALVEGNRQGRRVIPYDTLIVCQRFGERRANDALFDELQGAVPEVFKIGDCSRIRGIKEAIWSANEVARSI